MDNLEIKVEDLLTNMFNYYKKEDLYNPGVYYISFDDFCTKMVIFGITPDESFMSKTIKIVIGPTCHKNEE